VANAGVDDGPARSRAPWVAATLAAIVALDQLTKAWATRALADGPISVVGDTVELRLTRNPGGAFGNFAAITPVLAVAALAVSLVLVRVLRRASSRWTIVALTLVLGGALGNLVDRVARDPGFLSGHVVDFVSVGAWPVFNVADSCITVGAVVLVVGSLRGEGDVG
jgi:signal peptidase II